MTFWFGIFFFSRTEVGKGRKKSFGSGFFLAKKKVWLSTGLTKILMSKKVSFSSLPSWQISNSSDRRRKNFFFILSKLVNHLNPCSNIPERQRERERERDYPTTNGGMQKRKLSRSTHTLHARFFCTLGVDLHAQSALINKKLQHRSSVGSLSRVRGCRSGEAHHKKESRKNCCCSCPTKTSSSSSSPFPACFTALPKRHRNEERKDTYKKRRASSLSLSPSMLRQSYRP